MRKLAIASTLLALASVPARAAETTTIGVWKPPAGLTQISLWPNGAPDMKSPLPRERVMVGDTPDALEGATSEGVFDVTAPTITVFPPQGRNTGVSMIVFPGGGFQVLAITIEGTEICHWLAARGITCVLLKYRVPKSNHYWDKACNCHVTPKVPLALQDAQRAIRLVRARASDLHIATDKIGVMGFSAGGYLVAQTSNIFAPAYKPVDAVDRISSRPDFAVAAYPGHLCRDGGKLDPSIHVTKQTPPTFLLQAWDDPVDEICNSTLYARALDAAGVSTEVHLFAKGGHAFGLRKKDRALVVWPALVEAWLKDIGVMPGT